MVIPLKQKGTLQNQKFFTNYNCDWGLVSETYKELKKLNIEANKLFKTGVQN